MLRGLWASLLLSCIVLTVCPGLRAATNEPSDPAAAAARPPAAFPPNWLDWSGPPECPGPDHVENRLVEWLGAPPSSSLGLEVQSRVVWTSGGWEVHVIVHVGERSGERRVRLESCSDAADFVALAVALAVNPDLDPALAQAPDWIEAAEQTSESEPEASLSPLAPADTEQQETPPQGDPPPPPEPEPEGDGFAVLLGAGAELSMGALPWVHGGLEAELGVAMARWQAWLGGRFLPPTSEVFDGAATPIEFSLLAARVAASYELLSGPLCLGPSVFVEVGAIQAGQTSGSLDPPRGSELWAALGVGVEAAFPLEDWLVPVTSVELSIPLTRPHFVLDDGTLVHQPEVGFRAEIGARILLWTR